MGLGVLRASGNVLHCLDDKHETILTSEMGASAAVLQAGYNIDSLMIRYQVGGTAAGGAVCGAAGLGHEACMYKVQG